MVQIQKQKSIASIINAKPYKARKMVKQTTTTYKKGVANKKEHHLMSINKLPYGK